MHDEQDRQSAQTKRMAEEYYTVLRDGGADQKATPLFKKRQQEWYVKTIGVSPNNRWSTS